MTKFLATTATAAVCALAAGQNNRPIIGILSMPNSIPGYDQYQSYFPASYVKWIESAGARVVPLFYDQDLTKLQQTLKYINGALFTGGGSSFQNPDGSLTTFGKAGQLIFNESLTSWTVNGEAWPLWGTCQGFELINVLASGVDGNILTHFDAENISLPLTFTPAASGSRLYGSLPSSIVNILATEPVTMNNHQYGVAPADFNANTLLSSRFTILSNNSDREGNVFVSSIEGKSGLPIWASQYHPEKPQFEWYIEEGINHSFDSIQANSAIARFFVDQTRGNYRAFPSPDAEVAALIYNYRAYYTESADPGFEQSYIFPAAQ